MAWREVRLKAGLRELWFLRPANLDQERVRVAFAIVAQQPKQRRDLPGSNSIQRTRRQAFTNLAQTLTPPSAVTSVNVAVTYTAGGHPRRDPYAGSLERGIFALTKSILGE